MRSSRILLLALVLVGLGAVAGLLLPRGRTFELVIERGGAASLDGARLPGLPTSVRLPRDPYVTLRIENLDTLDHLAGVILAPRGAATLTPVDQCVPGAEGPTVDVPIR